MTTEPMEYRYPVSALLGDYLKAGLGIAITGVPLALAACASACRPMA